MATSSCLLEEFSCPVCLEILCDPATIPCGHSYCLKCIQKHWDKAAAKGQYSCPQCRQAFNPRPSLGRNNMLMEAMKKLRVGQDRTSSSSSSHTSCTTDSVASQVAPSRVDGSDGGAPVQGGLYPQLPSSSPKLCPVHQQVLELYCCDDKENVCEDCSLLGHKTHRVVRPDEEKEERRQDLCQEIQNGIQSRQRIIETLPQLFKDHKDAIQSMQRENLETFAELMKNFEMMSCQVVQLLQACEASTFNQIEGHRFRLQQEIGQLCKQEEELNRLASTEDSVQFLNSVATIVTVEQVGNGELEISYPKAVVTGIRSALGTFREKLDNHCKGSLADIFRVVNDAATPAPASNVQAIEENSVPNDLEAAKQSTTSEIPATSNSDNKPKVQAAASHQPPAPSANLASEKIPAFSNSDNKPKVQVAAPQQPPAPSTNLVKQTAALGAENPAPKTREEMLKYRFEPTLDHNTAYRHIRLSDGDRKATLRAENQNYPDHDERFVYWRQVMCLEPLAGSPYYWEMEWTGTKVTVGVAYKDMQRSTADDSSRLGHNERSWSLYWSGTAFSIWHAGKETALAAPKARKIGVYVDQQAGLLAFYRVSHNQVHQICCVETVFSGPLFPSFRFWSGLGSTVTLCQLD